MNLSFALQQLLKEVQVPPTGGPGNTPLVPSSVCLQAGAFLSAGHHSWVCFLPGRTGPQAGPVRREGGGVARA